MLTLSRNPGYFFASVCLTLMTQIMALVSQACKQLVEIAVRRNLKKTLVVSSRLLSKKPKPLDVVKSSVVENHRSSKLSWNPEQRKKEEEQEAPRDYVHIFPDFLPSEIPECRDRIKLKLERGDMFKRRKMINIPEFYVGSILAVTVADKYSPDHKSRFVGICISRGDFTLKHYFILRNVVDGQGIEIKYDMYSPLVQKIEVLKLEKRLDEELFYLRDCPQEYSTFPFDMDPVPIPKGVSVPINTTKVKLNPPPWLERWERMDLKGVENNVRYLNPKQKIRAEKSAKRWEKYDLMKHYRDTSNIREAGGIMKEVEKFNERLEQEYEEKGRKKETN